MKKSKEKMNFLRFPTVSLSAEYLTIGHLMRRNILAYKAPPNNEGYDLICIHPDPKERSKIIKVQVKSRYQTDSNRAVPVNGKTFNAFDYLIIVYLNIGYFYRKKPTITGLREVEFYTLPNRIARKHHRKKKSGWQILPVRDIDIERYKNGKGFEQIAKKLGVKYPTR